MLRTKKNKRGADDPQVDFTQKKARLTNNKAYEATQLNIFQKRSQEKEEKEEKEAPDTFFIK